MTPEPIDPQPIIYALSGIGLLLAIGVSLWQRFKKKAPEKPVERPPEEPREQFAVCMHCDAPARRPPSHFVGSEGFGAEMRVRFGAAQNYAPRIATDEPPALCPAHARTWDALLSEKATTTIARERAEAEVRIAREMAAFESEGLDGAMVSALTDGQRRALEKRRRTQKSGEAG